MIGTSASARRRAPIAALTASLIGLLAFAGSAWAAGCDDTWVAGSGDWSAGANWSQGSPPTSSQVACLNPSSAGPYTVDVTTGGPAAVADAITVGGSAPSNPVTLAIDGAASGPGEGTLTLTAAGDGQGILPTGAVTLGTSAQPGSLVSKSGTLANAGTVTSEATGGTGQSNDIGGGFDNAGTLAVDQDLTGDGPDVSSGTISVLAGATATFDYSGDHAGFIQSGGTIANQGAFVINDGSFVGAAGTSTGNPLTLTSDKSGLTVTAAGTGSDTLHVASGAATLGGNIGKGYTLWASGRHGVAQGLLTVPTSVINYGTLELGSNDGTRGTLTIQGGVFANDGTVVFADTGTGPDSLNGPLINNGSVLVENSVNGNGQVTNNASFALPPGETFAGTTFTQNPSGTLALGVAPGAVARLELSGAVRLAGTLATTTTSPVTGAFPVISAGALSGRFGSTRATGENFSESYATSGLTLTGPAGAPMARATIGRLAGGAGTLTVRLSCPTSGVCLGLDVRATVVERLHGTKLLAVAAMSPPARMAKATKSRTRTVTVASAVLSLSAGQVRTITIALNRTGRQLLKRRHAFRTKLTVTEAGQTLAARTVTLSKGRSSTR